MECRVERPVTQEHFSSDDGPESVTAGRPASKDPNKESKTKANRIDLVFDPDKSDKVTKCEKIVHVQFIRMTAEGVVVKPGDLWIISKALATVIRTVAVEKPR